MGGSRKVGPVPPVYNADRLMDMLKGTGDSSAAFTGPISWYSAMRPP